MILNQYCDNLVFFNKILVVGINVIPTSWVVQQSLLNELSLSVLAFVQWLIHSRSKNFEYFFLMIHIYKIHLSWEIWKNVPLFILPQKGAQAY